MPLTKPTRILITGASGLLGLNLALTAAGRTSTEAAGPGNGDKNHRSDHRFEVYGVTHHHPLQNAPFHVLQADLLERGALERLLDTLQPDWVIHCAALANLDDCEADPDLAHRLNAEIPGELAALVAKGGARRSIPVRAKPIRLVHISTDAVFDGVRGDYREEDQPNPLGVYARTKLAGEGAVMAANPQAIVARVNLFGWSLMGRRSLAEFFFNNLSAGKRVMGFTDVYFCPLLANHLADVLVRMLEGGLSGLYHVVSREATSKYDFGLAVARRFGLDQGLIDPTRVADSGLQAPRSPNLTLRTDKLSTALGQSSHLVGEEKFEIPSWQEGLERFYKLYQGGYPRMLRQLLAAG